MEVVQELQGLRTRQALECGMNAHIAKPIDEDKLLEALAGILKERADIK